METKKKRMPPKDEKREQFERMFRAEGLEPKPSLINWFIRLWAKDTGEAKAQGVQIGLDAKKEN